MGFEQFQFTKSWKNPQDFPTYEPDENQVRADLQQLHDEARDGINSLINALNDTSAAAQLPFAPVDGMTAKTVQEAIEEVYAAVTDAAAANIVDGSVSKGKLAAALLKRIYGGRVWVSLDEPGAAQNPDADFPVGQLWLRPACTVKNFAKESWEVDGGTAETVGDGWCFVTDGTQDYLTASQLYEAAGAAKQRVIVRLYTGRMSSHLNGAKLYLNGIEQEIEDGGGYYETELDAGGNLEIAFCGQWPYAEEDAVMEITDFAVVNAGAVEAALPDCEPCGDWPALLERLGSFEEVSLPMTLWLQTAAGQWQSVGHSVLPVSRGGTGLDSVARGALLYGTGGETLAQLPAVEQGILQWSEGGPQLLAPDTFARSNQFPYILTGSYVGNGGVIDEEKTEEEISVTLEMGEADAETLKFLLIYPEDGSCDTAFVANGGKHTGTYSFYDGVIVTYEAWVSLKGRVLTFSNEERGNFKAKMVSQHLNAKDVTYRWIAVCGGSAVAAGNAGVEKDGETAA